MGSWFKALTERLEKHGIKAIGIKHYATEASQTLCLC